MLIKGVFGVYYASVLGFDNCNQNKHTVVKMSINQIKNFTYMCPIQCIKTGTATKIQWIPKTLFTEFTKLSGFKFEMKATRLRMVLGRFSILSNLSDYIEIFHVYPMILPFTLHDYSKYRESILFLFFVCYDVCISDMINSTPLPLCIHGLGNVEKHIVYIFS